MCSSVSIKCFLLWITVKEDGRDGRWSGFQWGNQGGSDEFSFGIGGGRIGRVSMMSELSLK